MRMKARIRNIAKQKSIPAQVVLQNYLFERLLVRLSMSRYQKHFILKGGMLVAALVGLDNRATMDLDTTLKDFPLTADALESALREVFILQADDDVTFALQRIAPIREDDAYGGYRVSLLAQYDITTVPLSIDISTGDAVTPGAVRYTFCELFDPKKRFELWAYNIETVLAEKVETILRRGVFNTRPRDYYDVYILSTTQAFNPSVYREALAATAAHRGTAELIADRTGIYARICQSGDLQSMWAKYRAQFQYAQDIAYDDVMTALKSLI